MEFQIPHLLRHLQRKHMHANGDESVGNLIDLLSDCQEEEALHVELE